jgi:formiminoglutamate deiminase
VGSTSSGSYWCEMVLLNGSARSSVAIDVEAGRFSSIVADVNPAEGTIRLGGLTIPGLANAHSHAFHRALRSRTQRDRGTFWTWRDLMYRAADRLDPDSYRRLASATFAEMALAGVTCVGEFHYLHHQSKGIRYKNPNEMGEALLDAASEAGIRITLLDTLYLHAGFGNDGYEAPVSTQSRFSDGSAEAWAERVGALRPIDTQQIGAAIHSVRAVDPTSMGVLARWATESSAPIHAHVSEQIVENDACAAIHGRTPTGVLADAGVLSDRFAAVHATHLEDDDIQALAESGAQVVMCPTTERDLGDGIGPTNRLADEQIAMSLGSDSHAVIDLLEEARALELDERLRSGQRGIHSASELLAMATINGHRSLGWRDAGSIKVGNRADLVTIDLNSVRTSGVGPESALEAAVFAATSSDVNSVVIDGRRIVADGCHTVTDVPMALAAAIKDLVDS